MANPQPEQGFVKLANEIWNEIIRRDFSKRHKDIILFIWRLSYGCQKKTALIPKLKDFELCGVGYQNIRKELLYLSNCKVIVWDQSENIFAVNKDYDQWQISPVKGWDENRFKELVSLNIEKKQSKTSQNKKLKKYKLLFSSQNKKSLLLKIRSSGFSKQEVRLVSNPCGRRLKETPKDIFKDNIKNKRSSSCMSQSDAVHDSKDEGIPFTRQDAVPVTPVTNTDFAQDEISSEVINYRRAVIHKYLQRRGKGLHISKTDEMEIDDFIKHKVLVQTVLDGIDKAFDSFKPKHIRDEIRSLKFCSSFIFSLHASRQVKTNNNTFEKPTVQTDIAPDTSHTAEDVQAALAQLRAKG